MLIELSICAHHMARSNPKLPKKEGKQVLPEGQANLWVKSPDWSCYKYAAAYQEVRKICEQNHAVWFLHHVNYKEKIALTKENCA